MATQIEELESIPAAKPERGDKELLNEVTSIDFSPNEVKKLELKPNNSLEASNFEEQTSRPFAIEKEVDQENAVTEAGIEANQGESFVGSPPIPEVTANDSSSTPKEHEATKIKDQAEEFEIQTLEEEILKDQNIDFVASKETSDEQWMITEEKMKESQGDEREHVMDELARGGTLSESSSIKVKEVWLNDKENEGPNADDTDESTTKQIAKKENFKDPLLESTGEETVSYSQEENATEQGGKIESFGAIEDTIEFEKVENKIDSQDLASNEDDIIAKSTQEDETTKERLEQEVPKKSNEGTAEIKVQVIDEENTANVGPSAGEEINEPNMESEQKESDIEANRTNKEIEEQKTEESASNTDLPSTATGEEIVAEYLKEDDTDEVKPKEEVKNLETESIQNTDTKCQVEEEIHPKESNEDLVVSSLMPQVSQKETEDDNLNKKESATTELMEERSIKEVEKESNNSDLLLEEKSRAIEVGSDDVNIIAEHSEATEIVSYSQEEDATEQKGAEIESFDSIEDITEVEKVENKSDCQLESNTDDITAKSSEEDETAKEGPKEEVPRIRIEEAAEKEAQIIEEDKTESFGASADEESNEANLKMEQQESDIEANRTNKEIEEQTTEESASKTDLLSTATEEEIDVDYLKEDETDEVKPKDEVKNLETESLQNTHTTCHVEEEIDQEEINEDLIVSSSMPQVSPKETENDNLDKEESAITELTEERSIKKVEKESDSSDLLLEEKSRAIEVGSDDVNIIAEHSEATEIVSYSQEDATEQKGAEIESFDSIEDITEVKKVENKSDSQLESNPDDITAKSSEEDETAKEGPKEEVPRIRIEESAEKEAQIIEEDKTERFGPSADEESNEANLKMEQKESDIEANRTNKEIEKQKTEESAIKTDLLSTATEEEIDVDYLKEDEADEVKPKDEVKNLETESMQNTHTTCHIEEEIDQEEINEDLFVSSSMPQVSPKETENDNLDEEESAIMELTEERSIKEAEKESNSPDLLLEEKSRAIEVGSDDVNIIAEHSEVTEIVSYPQEDDATEQKGAEIESFDAIENITEVEKVENKSDSQDLESNMYDITAKSSQEDRTAKEGPNEEVPRIKIEEAAEKEAHITKEDNTANFGPSADEQSNEENLKMEQKESALEANSTNEDIEEQKIEESANKADLPSTATEEEIDVEYLKEEETDEVKPNEEVKNLEGDNLDKSEPVITELIEERSIKKVDQDSNSSDLLLEEKTYATIPKGEDERELTSGEMSISYLLEQTLEESSAPLVTESQLGVTEVSETINGNMEITENSNSNVQSLVIAETIEKKLEKKENEPMDPLEDTIVELKDTQMDNANAEEIPESVGPLELGSPIVLVAEGKSNETYHEINQTKTDEKENVNVHLLESAEEKVFLASDKTSEEKISREISQEEQNESEEVEHKSEVEPQINEAKYTIEAINDDILTEEVLGEAKKAEESEHINEQSGENIEEVGNQVDEAETAPALVEAADNLENEDSLLISELTISEHADTNKEATVVANSDMDKIEVEELKISDAELIREITETEEVQNIQWKPETSPTAEAPEEEILEETEKPINFTIAESAIAEANTKRVNIEKSGDHKDEAETEAETSLEVVQLANESKRDMDASSVDTMELQDDSSVISEVSAPEHAEIKECVVVEKSATDEVEELEISDERPIIGNTETAELQEVEDVNREAEASSTTKATEEETIKEVVNHGDESETAQETVVTEETSSEGVQQANLSARNLETTAGEYEAVDSIEVQEVNNLQLQDSSVISQLASTEHADVNKETMVVEELATDEAEVEELEISKAETFSYGQNDHPINESEKISSAKSSNTNTYKDEAGKETVCELDDKTCTTIPKGEDERETSIEQPLEESSTPLAAESQIRTTEVSKTIEGNTEIIENFNSNVQSTEEKLEEKENEPMNPIEDTTVELKDIQMDDVNVEEQVFGEVEKAEESEYINEHSEENIEEVGNHRDEAETALDTMELQDCSVISELTTPEHADINEETVVLEKSATNEVEELKIFDVKPIMGNTGTEELQAVEDINQEAEMDSYGKIAHQIHESEKISTGKSSDANTFDEETSEVLESKSDAEYEVIDNNVPEPTHSAEDLTEQFELPSSAALLGEQELQTTATTEKVEDESQMKDKTLANEKLESPIATNPKETCLPESEVEISTLDLELLDKNDSLGESSTRETEDLQEAKAEEPREVLVKSEETEMKEEQTQVAAMEFREKENLEEKLIKEDEANDDDVSSKKTTAGTEDDKDSSVASLEVVHIQELSQELEPVGENKNSNNEGKAAGDIYQDLNADGTNSSSCTLETEKDKNVEEAHARLDLQERVWNDTNVETMPPNQETEVVTAENGEAKKTEDIKEEFVEEDSFIRELQTTSASEETTNEIAYSDTVGDDKLESKAWSTETKVDELKATEDLNLESEASSITETSEKEIKQGTQNTVDTSSVFEVSVEEIEEENLKEAATFNEDIDSQPVTLVSETCLEEDQESEKEGSNKENQIEKADEANDKTEDTHSSEKVADDEGVARKSMATDPTAELSEDLPWIGAQGKAKENVSGAGEVIVNSNQDLVVEGTANENHSQEAAAEKNVNELPRKVQTQETVNQTDCIEIGVETIVPSEEISYSYPVRFENIEATDLTAETEIENLREEDLSSKSKVLANEMSPVVEVQEEDTREEKLEADINVITDTPPVTLVKETSSEDVQLSEHEIKGSVGTSNDENAKAKVDHMNHKDEVDSSKHEISSMVTQISREQHAFIGTEEVTAAKLNANEAEAEEIITSDKALASIDQDPKDVFETDKVQEEMNSIPGFITEENEDVKDSMSSASVPIEEEPRGIDAQEKAEIHNEGAEMSFVESCPLSVAEESQGTANENLPQETDREKNVNKPPSELELQAMGEEPEEKAISMEPIILIEENRETVPHEELTATYECVTKVQIDDQIPDTNSKTEDNEDQNLESTVEKIIGQDVQEVHSEMNKEVGHTLEEENEETQDVKETKKDVFLMEEISQEAVEGIREVEEIVNIKEEIMEGGSCTEELKATSETDENLSEITNSDPILIENVEEIRSLENESQGIKINSESEESKPMVEKEKLEKVDTDVKRETEIINIPDVDEIPVKKNKEQDIEDVQINREIPAGVSIGVEQLEERDFETELEYQADEAVTEGGKISDLTHLETNLTEKSRELAPSEMIQREQNSETTHTVDKVEDESEKKDGTLVTELEEDTLESRTIGAALLSKEENPKELENLGEKREKDNIQDFQKIEGVLEYLPESPSPNTITESEVREVEEVQPNPKTATIASVDEENQIQIANEKNRTITKEVSNDKTILDKQVAEDSLLLSADEERISGSCPKDELETQDYPGEITNQKLETTKIRIPTEEPSLEHEKAGEIKNIISLGDRNVSEILPEAIKGENEAPTELNHINTEDKTVIKESNVSEQDHLIKHETDQAGSTEKNNVIPNYEVRSKDFEAQADEGEGERKYEEKEEEQGEENEKVDSGSDGPVIVEVARDIDVKACKKSHGILSGVGSKVKHSISKVKKVITGKSSQKSSPSK